MSAVFPGAYEDLPLAVTTFLEICGRLLQMVTAGIPSGFPSHRARNICLHHASIVPPTILDPPHTYLEKFKMDQMTLRCPFDRC